MGERVTLCTIGFAKKSLRKFIGLLQDAGVTKVIDIRLHNTSQLAGYAKRDDLEFILETFGIAYEHVPELAPTEELMKSYKKGSTDWETYTVALKELLNQRDAARLWLPPSRVFDDGVNCLLCAEDSPKRCHRRLVAEHFAALFPDIEVRHLV
jgi:uncharacterized protein (DUF488 family)